MSPSLHESHAAWTHLSSPAMGCGCPPAIQHHDVLCCACIFFVAQHCGGDFAGEERDETLMHVSVILLCSRVICQKPKGCDNRPPSYLGIHSPLSFFCSSPEMSAAKSFFTFDSPARQKIYSGMECLLVSDDDEIWR